MYPDPADAGPADQPASVPRARRASRRRSPRLTHVVPFGRLDAVRRVLLEHPGEIAGMIIEPVMMNIGVVPPPPGYLDALAGLLHTHGALLTFDEVKTGLTIAPGGATERFGVVPDIVCLAKALAGGVPCGAIGGTAEVMGVIADGTYEQVGTFNGNPLTMAAAKAMLLEVLTPGGVRPLRRPARGARRAGAATCSAATASRATSARTAPRARSSSRPCASATTATSARYDARYGHAHWLYQHNGGVFLPPWGKMEQWTLSVQHGPDDVASAAANLERFARDLTR